MLCSLMKYTWLKMSEIAPDTVFAKCLLASFSPCFPIFIQSLKGILMMGWDIASGSKITDFEHIFKEPLIFLSFWLPLC